MKIEDTESFRRVTCCVIGCGPAGAMLGLMLAREGVDVLEKHADFLRDFRGDTLHPSTMEIMDELGLACATFRRASSPSASGPST
jgi:2-polyprenyl-6-methoxyphenol hydroxylase-like FAD-dependent oxidoreductase